jgi:hypothetical protein
MKMKMKKKRKRLAASTTRNTLGYSQKWKVPVLNRKQVP